MIDILTVGDDKTLNRFFFEIPYFLYRGDPCWVPPLRREEKGLFDAEVNPAMRFCNTERWVAIKRGRCVGRIAAIVNRKWIEKTGEMIGRINRFEVADDPDVAHALLKRAEDWLRNLGMTQVMGPLGFSNLDSQGLTVKGFDRLAAVGSSLTKPYYPSFFEAEGYRPVQDWNEYRITVPTEVPEKVTHIADLAASEYSVSIQRFYSQDKILDASSDIMTLFDKCFSPLFGTYNLGTEMHDYYIKRYIKELLPRYIFVAREGSPVYGRMVGFIIAMPSLSRALRRAQGYLYPFGWIHLKWAMTHFDTIETLLIATDPLCRRKGITAALMNELILQCIQDKVKHVETTAILDTNSKASSIVQLFDHENHKQKRCYYKQLISL